MIKIKNKIIRVLILFLLISMILFFSTLIIIKYSFPSKWKEIKIGQNRQQITNLIGRPTIDNNCILKGDIWIKNLFCSYYTLNVLYNEDKISYGYIIKFYLGSEIKNENLNWMILYKIEN